jgi:hypothetical protein
MQVRLVADHRLRPAFERNPMEHATCRYLQYSSVVVARAKKSEASQDVDLDEVALETEADAVSLQEIRSSAAETAR